MKPSTSTRCKRFLETHLTRPLGRQATITLRRDRSCNMAQVCISGQHIMTGNEWDFYPGCHGMDLPNFRDPEGLAALVEIGARALGAKPRLKVDDTWRYTY